MIDVIQTDESRKMIVDTKFSYKNTKTPYYLALGNSAKFLVNKSKFVEKRDTSFFTGKISLPLFLHKIEDLAKVFKDSDIKRGVRDRMI